jgi:ferredoxin
MAANTATKRLRVRVDPIRCTAFGFCAEFCPELFTLDEWGYAWLKEPSAGPEISGTIRETARLCPTGAILIEEVDDPTDVSANRTPVLRLKRT